jgi:hypothetical protein
MAKGVSFNFGANAKPKKARTGKSGKKRTSRASTSNNSKSNAWKVYIGSGLIPD